MITRNLLFGSTGADVKSLQSALNYRPTELPELAEDGIFGPKTLARVKEFQADHELVADGIAGPYTRDALSQPEQPVDRSCDCCNTESFVSAQAMEIAAIFNASPPPVAARQSLAFSGAIGSSSSGSALAATGGSGPIRMLDPSQQATARTVYGSSLDFSTIFISDKTGIGGRPFTIAFPDGTGQMVQIMNCGTFTPPDNTLIHELAHVWQSQHHSDKTRFMVNAIDSQAGAIVASTAAALDDSFVILNKDFPTFFPFDAYAYHPSLPFSSLAAEQMAAAIEHKEPAILSHIQGIGMNTIDSACITALSNPGFADRRLAGVK